MVDIIHRVGIAASIDEVFDALTTDEGLSRWWTTDTSGAGPVGSIIKFRFGGDGPDFEVTALETNSQVRWKHSGQVPEAWMGTEIEFQLSHENNQTYVQFAHSNWKMPSEFMSHCSTKWAIFLISLKDAIEKGKGSPFPDDIHIDHDE